MFCYGSFKVYKVQFCSRPKSMLLWESNILHTCLYEVYKWEKLTHGYKSQNIFITLGVEMSIDQEWACESLSGILKMFSKV